MQINSGKIQFPTAYLSAWIQDNPLLMLGGQLAIPLLPPSVLCLPLPLCLPRTPAATQS